MQLLYALFRQSWEMFCMGASRKRSIEKVGCIWKIKVYTALHTDFKRLMNYEFCPEKENI